MVCVVYMACDGVSVSFGQIEKRVCIGRSLCCGPMGRCHLA